MIPEFTAEQAHKAVARGAAWLDETCPTWVREIDLDALDLGEPELCVLGQTARCLIPAESRPNDDFDGDYLTYHDVIHHVGHGPFDDWAPEHGFNAPSHGDSANAEFEMLTIAWREYIRQRLEAGS